MTPARLVEFRMTASIDYPALDRALSGQPVSMIASELHGALSALAAIPDPAQDARNLDVLLEDIAGTPGEPLVHAARQVLLETRQALDDPSLGYAPLLPEGDAPLTEQAEALVGFCRGFLDGLGLAGAGAGRKLSPETDEALHAFAAIASGPVALDEDESGNFEALTELSEFVRIGVMLVHAELGGDADRSRE